MKNSNHLRNIVLVFAIIAVILAIVLYIYLYESTGGLVDNAVKARSLVSTADVMKVQEKEIMDLYQNSKDQRARISKLFVPSENAVSFIKAVESIGSESGASVNISAIRANAPADDAKTKIGDVTANVAVSGDWTEVMRALELFETLPYLNTINHITLGVSGGRDLKANIQKWQMSFDIKVSSL